ncbi:hypothetical protein ACTFIR_000998, partial [Dictyostelium discoideum]
YQIF